MNKKLIIALLVVVALIVLFFVYSQSSKAPDKNYVGNSIDECSRIQVTCVDGFQRFDDESGCGCEAIGSY